uniref:Uncharacterized protein n=1 Tax=Caenorhabditis japonica TaxID=281687 RepID=A0A8R1IPS1_CAEJA
MRFLIFLLLVVSSLVADGFPTNQSEQLAQPFINNMENSEWSNHPEFVHIRRRRWLGIFGDIAGDLIKSVGGLLIPNNSPAPTSASEQQVPTSVKHQPVPTSGSNGVTNNINGDTNNFG